MHPTRIHLRSARLTPLAAALVFAFAAGASFDSSRATAAPAQVDKATAAPRYALRLESRKAGMAGSRSTRGSTPTRPIHSANTLPVTSCGDEKGEPGSLRSVLAGAAEGDIVDLSALTCSTITLTQGPIDTSVLGYYHLYDVTLQGPGRDKLTIDGANASQVLVGGGFSSATGTLTVNDLTIANGRYSGSLAACILSFGGTVALNRVDVKNCRASGTYSLVFGGGVDTSFLEMTDSTITDSGAIATGTHGTAAGGGAYTGESAILVNSTISGSSLKAPYANYDGYATVGGGLYARGDLTLTNSTISGNTIEATVAGEDAPGGGIYVRGIALITGSTIDNNHADGDGGGICKAIYSVYGEPGGSNPRTKLTLVNSTVSSNISDQGGGGIASSRPVYLSNSTVADNFARGDGGGGVLFRLSGIIDSSGPLDMQSTIVARNSTLQGALFASDIDSDDNLVSGGANNLVTDAGAAIALPADTLSDDPRMTGLVDNGGPTRTHALNADSPAIDAGNNAAGLAFDQRGAGFARVSGAAADIGAFEAQQANDDVIFQDGFDGPIAPTTFVYSSDGDTHQSPP